MTLVHRAGVRTKKSEHSSADHYSPSGIFGDATLATREKGEIVVEAMVAGILREIEAVRIAPIPTKQLAP